MDIRPDQLSGQYERAIREWPWIHAVEAEFGLPRMIMVAIGSKETNLANIRGDFHSGQYHGFGVWQRDIQHGGVPGWWFDDVAGQCRWAAEHLVGKIAATGSFAEGVRAYNGSGSAARAYRDDVLKRLAYLTDRYPASPATPATEPPDKENHDMLYDTATPDGGKTFLLRGQGEPLWVRNPADVANITKAVKHVGELSYATHQSFGGT